MCPDREILSVYFDNELESPWKEKLESHLESCSQCRDRLTAYRTTRDKLSIPVNEQDMEKSMLGAMERVWEKIDQTAKPRRRFWSGTIAIPVPLAAAAGLVMILALAALTVLRQPQPAPAMAEPLPLAGLDMYEMFPTSDMASFFQYLENEYSNDMVIIRLPETTFMNAGEPTLLRAADFSRNGEHP